MSNNVFALMIHERAEPCEALKQILKGLGIDTFSVGNCAKASHLLEQTHPHLLFTDTKLPDGTWIDALNLAEAAPAPVCSIIVAGSKDPELRQAALAYGAFDCLDTPFDPDVVSEIVRRAVCFVQERRAHRAQTAVA